MRTGVLHYIAEQEVEHCTAAECTTAAEMTRTGLAGAGYYRLVDVTCTSLADADHYTAVEVMIGRTLEQTVGFHSSGAAIAVAVAAAGIDRLGLGLGAVARAAEHYIFDFRGSQFAEEVEEGEPVRGH